MMPLEGLGGTIKQQFLNTMMDVYNYYYHYVLTSKASADLALVIEKENGVYRASTCLTLDMAINNARLIAKPDDEWLKSIKKLVNMK